MNHFWSKTIIAGKGKFDFATPGIRERERGREKRGRGRERERERETERERERERSRLEGKKGGKGWLVMFTGKSKSPHRRYHSFAHFSFDHVCR